MTNVEAENAVMRERARIREAVVNTHVRDIDKQEEVLIRRSDVLKILNKE